MSRGRRLTAPHPSSPCPRSSEKGGVCLLWQNPAAPCSSLLPSLPPAFALSSFGSAPASCTWKRSCCLVLLRTQKTSLSSAVLPHPRVGDRNSYLKRLQDGPGGQETGLTCSEITQIDGKRGHHSPMAGVAVRRSFPSRITAKISHTIASKLIPHQNIIYSACQQLLTPLLAQDLRHKSPKEAPCAHLPSLC
ncbi:uncharacterized protein LOC133625763 isoform X3 [Colius striatus]|uniref:uncharacterized protein LOC133625763 isoform X3 n=1 Tax=Colius striatus TaxID=57412 RepID=UPI002B1D94DA|nr:uncharacterized protein LOC133625763 isoform X3 [Colius striatus]